MSIRKLEQTTLKQLRPSHQRILFTTSLEAQLAVVVVVLLLFLLKRNLNKHTSPLLGMQSHKYEHDTIRFEASKKPDYLSKCLVPNENHFLRKRNSQNWIQGRDIDPTNAV